MPKAKLIKIHDDGSKIVNVFVHGYNCETEVKFQTIVNGVHKLKLAGKVYVLCWKSGNWTYHNDIANIVVTRNPFVIFVRYFHFLIYLKRAVKLGENLKKHISKIPNITNMQVNLIGFSLGARVIKKALLSSNWTNYKVQNLVLLAGAADTDTEDWVKILKVIKGRIINVFSKNDLVLHAQGFKNWIGRNKIDIKNRRIINRRYRLGHAEYINKIDYILGRVWKDKKISKKYTINYY